MMRVPLRPFAFILSLVMTAWLLPAAAGAAGTLDRPLDPVVLTGSELPLLTGLDPSSVVGFRFDGGWIQIPIQIDERNTVTYDQVYDSTSYGADIPVLAYTDEGTYVGADTDPAFDADDELVFMAKDAGDVFPGGGWGPPAGVVAGSGVELRIDDSLDGGWGYVYLFESDGGLTPDAGVDYVSYAFTLLPEGTTYLDDYNLASGPNPEDSSVVTARYESHFSERWIHDEMKVPQLAPALSPLALLVLAAGLAGLGSRMLGAPPRER